MILVDTSIRVGHLRKGNETLARVLEQGMVVTHPFVIGELACGSIGNRREIMGLLESLPDIGVAGHAEVLHLVEGRRLYNRGIGWVDAHLLASALLSGALLWTSEDKLRRLAEARGVAYR